MRILVTGASGYIGGRLLRLAQMRGHEVVAASRRPLAGAAFWLPFDLTAPAPVSLPGTVDAVVHLAAATAPGTVDPELEVAAAQSLITAARQWEAKLVFVSSQTARQAAPTSYGRTKWRIEREVLAAGGWVLRPGQVYGGPALALFGELVRTVRRWPLLPAFVPAPMVQPVHVDDLAEAILGIAERQDIPADVFCVGAAEPMSFTHFLRVIAVSRLHKLPLTLPIPVPLVRLMARTVARRWQGRLGLERLDSLFDLLPMETAADLRRLGVVLRPLCSGMHPSGSDRRRCLLREGRTLLAYLLKGAPGMGAQRRYVRAIEALQDGRALALPSFAHAWPPVLALFDRPTHSPGDADFRWRLHAATALAEATPQGAARFLGVGTAYRPLAACFRACAALGAELLWRVLHLAASPLLRRGAWLDRCRR